MARAAPTYVVADSGAWVAVLRDEMALTLFDGHTGVTREVRIAEVISEEEQQVFSQPGCGNNWLTAVTARVDRLTIEVQQGGNRRPNEVPGPTVRLTVDAMKGTIERGPALPRPGIPELLARSRAGGDDARVASDLLLLKAQLRSSKGDLRLCEFFANLARGAAVRDSRASIDALGELDCRTELAALPVRGDDADLAILEQLERFDPPAAEKYALQVLTARREPILLRQRSAGLLIKDRCPARFEAAKLALSDTETSVRTSAISDLSSLSLSDEAFALLFSKALGAPDDETLQARFAVLSYFEHGEARWRPQLIAAEKAGRLDRWPVALVVVAGLADGEKQTSRAETLYRRAADLLDGHPRQDGRWLEAELWAEAKLRLAQIAATRGQRDVALKLANDVVATGTNQMAAAPDPNRFAGGHASRQATVIADELIKSGGEPPPEPRLQVDDALKILREAKAMMAEQKRLRDERKKARLDAGSSL